LQQKIDDLFEEFYIVKFKFEKFKNKKHKNKEDIAEIISAHEKLLKIEKEIFLLKNN